VAPSFSLRLPLVRVSLFGALLILAFALVTFAQGPDAGQLFQDALEAQQRGDAALAVSKYENLLRLYPDMVAARVNLGVVLISLGRFDDAIMQYRTALRQAPSDRDLRLKLGLAYFKKRDYPKAADEFGSLHDAEPSNVRVATLLGICYVRLGRNDDAISLLMPLAKTEPDNLDLKWALGWALIGSGRAQEVLERVEKVAEQGHSAEAYILAAESYLTLTFFDRARRDADAAIRLNPNLPRAYIVIGVIDERVGDEKGARAAYEMALQANPNEFRAHFYLGALLYTERQLNAAREHLVRALELDPSSALARYQLARVERAQGDVQAAVKDLEAVEREEPHWLKPHVELAALYFFLKRRDDGAREKKIVDQLGAEEQQPEATMPIIIPPLPSP
jgi:tetratricopeptide (TPR) repeat protein